MTKTHKAVLSTLAVLCLLFMGSGVAQAQMCVARAISPGMVRAEGITEVVASIELKCGRPATDTFGFNQVPTRINIAVELNARITNEINDTRVVAVLVPTDDMDGLGYKSREIDLRGNTLTSATGTVNTTPGDDIMMMFSWASPLTVQRWALAANFRKTAPPSFGAVLLPVRTGTDFEVPTDSPMTSIWEEPEQTASLVSVWLLRESAPTPPRWAMVKISPLLLWSTARRWGIPSKSRTCLPAWQSRRKKWPRASNAQAAVKWL